MDLSIGHETFPSHAPWYSVPKKSIVSIEHPYIITNAANGVASLGGTPRLDKLVEDGKDSTASLYLRPGNRLSKPLPSYNVTTDNILLKITVPKRTGLKRKRGSEEPYHEGRENQASPLASAVSKPVSLLHGVQYLFRSLHDNPQSYQINAVGEIQQTHRFRGMPDFVQSSTESPFMDRMKENILSFEYEKMKAFKLDMSKGVKTNTEIIPPPRWSHFNIPFNYLYRQNLGVAQSVDNEGNLTTYNAHTPRKVLNPPVPFDVAKVPSGPSDELPPLESLDKDLQRLIFGARKLFEQRPIYTRRALANSISCDKLDSVGQYMSKYVYQYIGYGFASGPWRDAIVKFGVDPRSDPKYRIYQTMMFQLESGPRDSRAKPIRKIPSIAKPEPESGIDSHLFDGQTVSIDGKQWQVIDITDPVLKDMLNTTNLRKQCHIESDGWYCNGTWAKAKTIMKAKISAILTGAPALTDAQYRRVIQDLSDVIDYRDRRTTRLSYSDATAAEVHLATQIRSASVYDKSVLTDPSETGGALRGQSQLEDDTANMDTGPIDPILSQVISTDSGIVEGSHSVDFNDSTHEMNVDSGNSVPEADRSTSVREN